MKRHPALVPLSRDHHHALVIAQALRRPTADTAAEAARAFLAHWEDEERGHVRVEEELLCPRMPPAVTRVILSSSACSSTIS